MSGLGRWFSSDVIVGAVFLLVLAGGAFLMFAGYNAGSDPATAVKSSGGDKGAELAAGKKLYGQYCASCHGANLEGEKDWRTRNADGTLKAPPHDATGHTWHHSDDLLFRYTKDGGAKVGGGAFKSAMPGFGDQLSDRQIRAILAYIKSRWPKEIRDRQAEISSHKN